MFQAVLSNPDHPDYGVVTIPFPIPHDQYAHCMELLEALEIGDAVKADCKVEKIDSFYTVLKRVEMLTVNVEERTISPSGWIVSIPAKPHSFRRWPTSWSCSS